MKKLLFIEDDVALQGVYRDAFASQDVSVDIAVTAGEALTKLKKNPPDAVILDIMLPGGMNGFDVLEQMKKDPALKAMPVLVLTNLDSERKTALSIGANDYVIKGTTSVDDVVARVKKLL